MKRTIFLFLCACSFFLSCEDTTLDTSVDVVTEEILYVSGDRLLVTGRILAVVNVEISDHGFELSTDENFSNVTTINLGERTLPGSFIGESNTLEIESDYFCRAFLVEKGERKVGNVVTFKTLLPTLGDFNPKIANVGQPITITGTNFTSSTEVFFGQKKVDIISLDGESVIQVKAPSLAGSAKVDVTLRVNGKNFKFDEPFEYIVGIWTFRGDPFDEKSYYGNVSFQENGIFYFGLGSSIGAFSILPGIYKIDPASANFQLQGFPHTPTLGAFYDGLYLGGGSKSIISSGQTVIDISDEFIKLENGEFKKVGVTPFLLYNGQAFSNGDDLYVYGGVDDLFEANYKIHHYDGNSDTWNILGQSPFRITGSRLNFKNGLDHYFFTPDSEIWKFSLSEMQWSKVTTFPDQISPGGFVQVIENNVYLGLMDNSRNVWKYEIEENKWIPKPGIPNITDAKTAASWIEGEKIFVFTKTTPNFSHHRLWIFEPNAF